MSKPTAVATATIVGGGPAGLFAAETLAEHNIAVTIYDHMPTVGRKFLLAGRGGLNITHTQTINEFLDRYGAHREFLEPAIKDFGPDDLRRWCEDLGEPTFVGTSGRVFPKSFRATRLLRAWLKRLNEKGVDQKTRHRWLGWQRDAYNQIDPGISNFADENGAVHKVTSDVTLLAMGGASWPRVGSTGNWVSELQSAGVPIEPLKPANCGVAVKWSNVMTERFGGTPLKNVSVNVDANRVRGDVMITKRGLEGGPIYAHSASITQTLDATESPCLIQIDLHPDLDSDSLTARLTKRRRPKDSIATWLKRSGIAPAEVALMREAKANQLPSSPNVMAALIKSVPIHVKEMMPIDRAISTAGGVSFSALDKNFMINALPGVFVAGEMLDWQAPTGGYLLQATFSSARAAAQGAIEFLKECNQNL